MLTTTDNVTMTNHMDSASGRGMTSNMVCTMDQTRVMRAVNDTNDDEYIQVEGDRSNVNHRICEMRVSNG